MNQGKFSVFLKNRTNKITKLKTGDYIGLATKQTTFPLKKMSDKVELYLCLLDHDVEDSKLNNQLGKSLMPSRRSYLPGNIEALKEEKESVFLKFSIIFLFTIPHIKNHRKLNR